MAKDNLHRPFAGEGRDIVRFQNYSIRSHSKIKGASGANAQLLSLSC
jgi:hypothetical protein